MKDQFPHALGDPSNQRTFTYFSEAKAVGFDCTASKRAKSAGIAVTGVSANASLGGHPLTKTQKANKILEHLRTNGLLSFAPGPYEDYLIAEAVLECGTMWPWAGRTDEMSALAWWLGNGENIRILAYGHIRHLTDQGSVPEASTKSYWWPSRADAYRQILENLTVAADQDAAVSELFPDPDFGGIVSECFNPNVKRGQPISNRKLYTILLRIDQVQKSRDGKTTIFGSPIWVERNKRLRGGLYLARDADGKPFGLGLWDGSNWTKFVDRNGQALAFRDDIPDPANSDIIRIDNIPDFPSPNSGDSQMNVKHCSNEQITERTGFLEWIRKLFQV